MANPDAQKRKWKLSRRDFLIAMGLAGGGLVLGWRYGLPRLHLSTAQSLDGAAGMPESFGAPPDAWFEISPENDVRLFVPKVEMGQGIHTAFAQIAAEELEVPWERIEVHHLPTQKTIEGQQGSGVTGSSNSVSSLFTPLSEAAANMREMLRAEAAELWGLPHSELEIEDGEVFVRSAPDQRKSYGEIVAATREWEVPEEAPKLKSASQYRLVGTSQPRVDLPDKISGKAIFGYDARLPNMLYGAIPRPPVMGAELLSAGPGTAADQSGVVKVVADKTFVGVVGESRLYARTALSKLELEWSTPQPWQQEELEEMVKVGSGDPVVIQQEGDPVEPFLESGRVLEAEYRSPFAAHAHLEPQAALANAEDEKVEIWTSTQAPWSVQQAVAEALDREVETVHVTPTFLGGGFGRRIGSDVAVEAALLSASVNRPVHVGWERAEEFQNGFLRPPTHSKLRARLDDTGQVIAIDHQQASGDVAFPFVPGFLQLIFGADFGATRGANVQYRIPHRHTVAWRTKLPIPTGWWRGLGLMANIFAVESFMDELASAAGADPLEFRLRHIPDGEKRNRYKRVLETVGERSGWGTALPAGRARGIAICDDVNTIVAQVAEVSVDRNQIMVHKVTAAMDCGLVINPDGAIAQAQGGIVMGLSSTLKEQIQIRDGRVTANNFNGYPLLRMDETPDIDVVLLESGDQPYGVGEPPIGPVPAAVANAVFSVTGKRLRSLPLRYT